MSDASHREHSKFYNMGLKYEVLKHYSKGAPCCAECGCHDLEKLQLDHINNDGKEQRMAMWASGYSNQNATGKEYYRWLLKNNYSYEGLQVLCKECHAKKGLPLRNGLKFTVSIAFNWDNPIPDVKPVPLWDEAS